MNMNLIVIATDLKYHETKKNLRNLKELPGIWNKPKLHTFKIASS